MGLAWTAMGGNALYVEAASVESGDGKGSLRTTGTPPVHKIPPVSPHHAVAPADNHCVSVIGRALIDATNLLSVPS